VYEQLPKETTTKQTTGEIINLPSSYKEARSREYGVREREEKRKPTGQGRKEIRRGKKERKKKRKKKAKEIKNRLWGIFWDSHTPTPTPTPTINSPEHFQEGGQARYRVQDTGLSGYPP
jgi:hypothetical protein